MNKNKRELTRALYENQLSEDEIVKRFRITRMGLRRFMESEEYRQEIERICEHTERQTRCILSRFGPVAALKLAELLGSDKPDIARRAALDMIDRCVGKGAVKAGGKDEAKAGAGSGDDSVDDLQGVSDEQVRDMLLKLSVAMQSAK